MAGIRIGKREKIIVGAILGMACILALHVLVYSKRTKTFLEAKETWERLKNDYSNMGNVQNPKEIQAYKTKTNEYIEEFNQSVKDLNLEFPPHHGNPEDPENAAKIFQETYDFIKKLRDMAEGAEAIKYTFLNKDGWNYPTKLPEPIMTKRVNLGDLIEKIKDVQEILRVISPDNAAILSQKQTELKNLKKEIGIDVDLINQLSKYGEDIPRFILLAHSNLILEAKPEDYALTRDNLYTYLDIVMPKYVVALTKQMEGASDILERAKKAGIEEIKELYFLPESKIYVNKTTGETAGEIKLPAQTRPGAGAVPGISRGVGMEGEMMGGEFSPDGFAPGMGAEDMKELGGGAMEEGMTLAQQRQPQQQQPQGAIDTLLAIARPVKIKVSGPNLNVMNFLYDLCHCKKTYELDDLLFQSTQEGRVDCTVTINLLAWIDKAVPMPIESPAAPAPPAVAAEPPAAGAPPVQ